MGLVIWTSCAIARAVALSGRDNNTKTAVARAGIVVQSASIGQQIWDACTQNPDALFVAAQCVCLFLKAMEFNSTIQSREHER
jgi:hypothetical protein